MGQWLYEILLLSLLHRSSDEQAPTMVTVVCSIMPHMIEDKHHSLPYKMLVNPRSQDIVGEGWGFF